MTEHPFTETGSASNPPALMTTLGVATTIQVVATSSVLALTAIAPYIASDLGVAPYFIGYQISLIYTAGMVSSAVAGSLVARYGPSRVEQAALSCFLAGFLGLCSGQLTVIAFASLLIGIGYGLNNPAASELLSRVTPHGKRNVVFSVKQSGVPIGGIFASFAFPFIAGYLNWQASLGFGAAVALATMLLLAATHPEKNRPRPGAQPFGATFLKEQSLIWHSSKLRTLSLLGFGYSAMQLSASTFAVIFLVEHAGWHVLAAGSVAAAMQFAGAVGRIFWGSVANRLGGGLKTLGLLGLLGGAGFAGLAFAAHLPVALQVALFLLIGCTSISWNGVLLAEVAHAAPQGQIGALTGGVLVYTFIGVIIGPSTFASLYALTGGYGASFCLFSLFGFSGMWLAWQAHRAENQHICPYL